MIPAPQILAAMASPAHGAALVAALKREAVAAPETSDEVDFVTHIRDARRRAESKAHLAALIEHGGGGWFRDIGEDARAIEPAKRAVLRRLRGGEAGGGAPKDMALEEVAAAESAAAFEPHGGYIYGLKPGATRQEVLFAVAVAHGLTPRTMMVSNRRHALAHLRQRVMYLMARLTDASTPAIGNVFGVAHTTVLYGIAAHCLRHGLPHPRGQSLERAFRAHFPLRQRGSAE